MSEFKSPKTFCPFRDPRYCCREKCELWIEYRDLDSDRIQIEQRHGCSFRSLGNINDIVVELCHLNEK